MSPPTIPVRFRVVIGMRSRYIEISPAAIHSVMGVIFRPGGARAFFDVPADEFSGHVVTLDLVWGCAVHGLRDRLWEAPTVAEKFRLLECELQRRVQPRVGLHPAVRYGLTEFHRGPHLRGVLEVTKDAGLSRRRFAQLFREQVGMTPKRYCRLHRFHNVTRQICAGEAVDWADLALAATVIRPTYRTNSACSRGSPRAPFWLSGGPAARAWIDRLPSHSYKTSTPQVFYAAGK
jgi:AraC-like DNA-binding protein